MAKKKAFLIRVDEKLWKDLQRWAQDELRSLNGQVEYLLREALRRSGREKKAVEREGEDE